MTRKENPAPRGNAGNRANPKVEQGHIRGIGRRLGSRSSGHLVCAVVRPADGACAPSARWRASGGRSDERPYRSHTAKTFGTPCCATSYLKRWRRRKRRSGHTSLSQER